MRLLSNRMVFRGCRLRSLILTSSELEHPPRRAGLLPRSGLINGLLCRGNIEVTRSDYALEPFEGRVFADIIWLLCRPTE